MGWPRTPKTPLSNTKFIIHPVDLKAKHWGIIIVRLHYNDVTQKLRVHVYMYEPLIDDDYHEEMETVWERLAKDEDNENEGLRGFLDLWHQASVPKGKLVIDPIEWVDTAQQPDLSSCGVLVVAQAHNYITGNLQRQNYNVSKQEVKAMRLRMLWMIMCYAQERTISDSDAAKNSKIHQQLLDQL